MSASHVPPHFIVFVPGYMGSKLRDPATGTVYWLDLVDLPRILLTPNGLDNWLNALKYPNVLEPFEMLDHILYAPPWIKMEGYAPVIPALEGMGYRANPKQYAEKDLDVYTFPYDWRQDNRLSGHQLGAAIERWSALHPGARPIIIAHSNGGVVARWYIEKEGGKERVARLFLMGSPRDGTPTAMHIVFTGFDALMRQVSDWFALPMRSRDLFRTFPSIYQIIPARDAFLRSTAGDTLDFAADGAHWLGDAQERQLAADGRRFSEELGTGLSVDTVCIFGRKRYTYSAGTVHLDAAGQWSAIDWQVEAVGDGTIPERSAFYPDAHKQLPFAVDHGHLYYDPAVLAQLEWELLGQYENVPERAYVATRQLGINFAPSKDFYLPGEALRMRASVHRAGDDTPRTDARIRVQVSWLAALPGAPVAAPPEPVVAELTPAQVPGEYEGSVMAPSAEGYYRLRAVVSVPDVPQPVALEELAAVQAAG